MRQSLYVAHSACGIVKVGRAAVPERRSLELRTEFRRRYGAEMCKMTVCGELESMAPDAEAALVAAMDLVPGRFRLSNEWFYAVPVMAAIEEAMEVVIRFKKIECARAARHCEALARIRARTILRDEAFAPAPASDAEVQA